MVISKPTCPKSATDAGVDVGPPAIPRAATGDNTGVGTVFRNPAFVTLLVVFGLLAVVAAILVPWGPPATPSRAAQLAAVAKLPPEVVAAGKAFAAATRPGSYLSMGIGLVVALVLGLTPIGATIVAACGRLFGGHWLAEAVLGGLAIMIISQAVTLPLSAWRHTILVRYGMSTQGWGGWIADVARSYAVTIVVGALILAAFYGLTRLSPQQWWAWAAGGAAVLVMLGSAVYPILIEPVFNSFSSLDDGPLKTELLEMAERDGVPVGDVLVADASRRTNAVNAYVSGLGPTRRIVVYDTLLTKPDDEVVSVVAHELGHAKNGDVWIGTALGALGAAAGVCLLALLGTATGFLRRLGIDTITSPRGVALLLAVFAVVGLVATPIQNIVSRSIELRADEHALELTGDPGTFIRMQTTLAETNLSDVDPPVWLHWYFGSHPTTAQRIALAEGFPW